MRASPKTSQSKDQSGLGLVDKFFLLDWCVPVQRPVSRKLVLSLDWWTPVHKHEWLRVRSVPTVQAVKFKFRVVVVGLVGASPPLRPVPLAACSLRFESDIGGTVTGDATTVGVKKA